MNCSSEGILVHQSSVPKQQVAAAFETKPFLIQESKVLINTPNMISKYTF